MSENDRLITETRGIQHTRIAVKDVCRAFRVRNTKYAYSNQVYYAEPTVLSTTATDLHRLRMLSVVDVGDVLGALAWCLGSQRRLLQRCTILLFLWLCNFHWNLLPARDCQQKIASDCLDTACSRRATEVKRALRSDSHRIARDGSTELLGWNWVRSCVGRKSEIPSL